MSTTASRAGRDVDIEALLADMTLEEKLGQLNMPIPSFTVEGTGGVDDAPGTDDELERFTIGTYNPALGAGGGTYGLAQTREDTPRGQAALLNKLQRVAAEQTRQGIPLLAVAEGCHGVLAPFHTVFPEGLALGSSFDVDLVERVYAAVAREARAIGVHALSTLVVEPIRDPRLGRNCESYTEDPYLLSRVAEAIVEGCQGDDLTAEDRAIALLTCFPAQSEGVSGLERGAMEVSERTLRQVFLPPWEAGITRKGALGVMATYVAVDGRVAHGDEWIMTTLLRDEIGFEGIVFSEGRGFLTLQYEGIVEDQSAAGAMSIKAGVDVNITYEKAFLEPLRQNVLDGVVPMAVVDRAVRRVLEVKKRLGLFDSPYVDEERAERVVHSPEHVELALEAARAGIVLLKNEGDLLPLSRDAIGTVAVIGPNADNIVNQQGDYAMTMFRADLCPPGVTVLDGIRNAVGDGAEVVFAKGCEVTGDDRSGFDEAVAAASAADVAVVVVGEQGGYTTFADNPPTVGEQADVADLDLSGVQEDLIKAVHATGTPVVVVLVNGRPLSTRWAAEHVPALVEAWLPGEQGGAAVADVLFGDVNPSGRLAITVPRHVGQLPVYYNQRWGRMHIRSSDHSFGRDYSDMPARPLFEFGFGLSYTTFEYADLRLSYDAISATGTVEVSVDVTNVGSRAGVETVQLYVRDVLASLAPYAKQLRGFAKVPLEPGETRTASFTLGYDDLKMLDASIQWVVEPGEFEIQVGASSDDIRAVSRFTVLAPA